MIRNLTFAIVVSAMIVGCTPKLETDKQQQSYAIGYALGQQLTKVKNDVDVDIVARGLKDGIASEKPKIQDTQMADRVRELQQKQNAQEAVATEERRKKADVFLAGVAKEPGARALEPGLIVKVKKPGTGSARSLKDDEQITVRYTANHADGSLFDQTSDANGIKVRFRDLSLPGLKKAILKMPVGAEWLVYLGPDQAFGSGTRPGVPAGSALIYDIELLAIGAAKTK